MGPPTPLATPALVGDSAQAAASFSVLFSNPKSSQFYPLATCHSPLLASTRRSMPAHRTCHASLRECRGVCPGGPRAGRWWRGRGRRFRSTAAAVRGARDEFPGAPGRLGLGGRVSGGAGAARAGCGRCRRRRDGAGGRAGGHARPDHGGHDRRLAPHLHGALVARSSLRRCVKFATQRESRDSSGWGRSARARRHAPDAA